MVHRVYRILRFGLTSRILMLYIKKFIIHNKKYIRVIEQVKKMSKHYCIFSAQYYPHVGGVERYTLYLSRKLIAAGKRSYYSNIKYG